MPELFPDLVLYSLSFCDIYILYAVASVNAISQLTDVMIAEEEKEKSCTYIFFHSTRYTFAKLVESLAGEG